MSTINLSKIGSYIGGSVGGPIGAMLGKEIGSSLEKARSKKDSYPRIEARLAEITTQTAIYGRAIPLIYGTVKLAGNIIWASKIKEHREDHYQRQSKFGSRSLVGSQFYYTISLAIAIAAGEINEILRVWANDRLIDTKNVNYRFYNGSETQMPDPLIEAYQGHKKTPSFRGLAYVVIENLPLIDFSNHIPNFVFEVRRQIKDLSLTGETSLEERIKAMIVIPGSGEFVYDTNIQSKVPKNYNPKYGNFNAQKTKINQNNRENKADSLVSLDQLKNTCPNLEWISPVVGWFANSLHAGNCSILPGIEYRSSETLPDQWKVANYTRENAYLISKNGDACPNYGGTSNDRSILRYLDAIKTSYKYKIMFYPMIFVDKHNKPWRGRITGDPEGIKRFFYGKSGYNRFILHYANLVKDKVDAFIIGSELIGLTKVRDQNNNFPAVDALIDLAKKVKAIVGDKVKISCGADWSEYHHTEYGWYNLDPLWASEYIDFIGIDAYFPLTNSTKNIINEKEIMNGWESGEGYEYYYIDENRLNKQSLDIDYAWKNIHHWWANEHINPDHNKTAWKAKSKKIWFTEIGFPSVDLASNQPNVFYNPGSMESSFPIHSKGKIDFSAQRLALSASEKYWRNSEFLEHMFIWTWDARPYPFWPDLNNIWTDGKCWARGHWVNGKLGLTSLKAIIQELSLKSDVSLDFIIAENLRDFVDGLIISNQDTAKEVINLLKSVYFFDTYERDGKLCFVKKMDAEIVEIEEEYLVSPDKKQNLLIKKASLYELPKSIAVHYFNYLFDYQLSLESSSNNCYLAQQFVNLHLPIVISPQKAKNIADITLQETLYGQLIYEFTLLPSLLSIKPGDVIHLKNDKALVIAMRVISSVIKVGRVNQIKAISIKQNIYDQQNSQNFKQESILFCRDHFDPGYTDLVCLRLPKLPYQVYSSGIYLGVIGGDMDWRGAEVLCPDNNILYFSSSVTYGVVENFSDDYLQLFLFNSELFSKSEQELARYSNLALIGEEVIQFKNAEFQGNNRYRLSGIKRNMFGSKEDFSKRFILWDNKLQHFALSEEEKTKKQEFIVTSIGHNIDQAIKIVSENV